MKFIIDVEGTITKEFSKRITVFADNEEEAVQKAYDKTTSLLSRNKSIDSFELDLLRVEVETEKI